MLVIKNVHYCEPCVVTCGLWLKFTVYIYGRTKSSVLNQDIVFIYFNLNYTN